jgi:hypothetical protein
VPGTIATAVAVNSSAAKRTRVLSFLMGPPMFFDGLRCFLERRVETRRPEDPTIVANEMTPREHFFVMLHRKSCHR